MHTFHVVFMRVRVCATGGSSVGDSALIIAVTKASPPITFVIAPFPESVGGRGRMEGGHKGKEEGKGRREKSRVDDGKCPPPRCHTGGGLKESVASRCSDCKPILSFVLHPCLTYSSSTI